MIKYTIVYKQTYVASVKRRNTSTPSVWVCFAIMHNIYKLRQPIDTGAIGATSQAVHRDRQTSNKQRYRIVEIAGDVHGANAIGCI